MEAHTTEVPVRQAPKRRLPDLGGRSERVVSRLLIAPGQILMSAAARRACADAVDTRALDAVPGGAIEAHLLLGIRPAGD